MYLMRRQVIYYYYIYVVNFTVLSVFLEHLYITRNTKNKKYINTKPMIAIASNSAAYYIGYNNITQIVREVFWNYLVDI